jgi:hypothetical protein
MNLTTRINFQEIEDYKLLYHLFGDEVYLNNWIQLENQYESILLNYLNDDMKYLMLNNNQDPQKTHTSYATLIIVNDKNEGVNKIKSLITSLGKVDYIEDNKDYIEIKIKDGYLLHLYDYTNGVI